MSHLAIDPVHAESAAGRLDAVTRRGWSQVSSTPAHRSVTASSSLAAAITQLEHRLAAVDDTLATHLVTHAIELRSAAEEARHADG